MSGGHYSVGLWTASVTYGGLDTMRGEHGTLQMGIRILLADHESLFRVGIKAAFQSERAIDIVGEAATTEEAIEKTGTCRPDVVVIERGLPGGDGIAAIGSIRRRWPRTQVLVVTSLASEDGFRRAAAAGASGYVLKDISPINLVNAVRAVYAGNATPSAPIAGGLFRDHLVASPAAGTEQPQAYAISGITQNETKVIAGVVQGLSDKEIAAKLFVSESTVKSRLRYIYQKLRLRNRAQLAVFAIENGIRNTLNLSSSGGELQPRHVPPRKQIRSLAEIRDRNRTARLKGSSARPPQHRGAASGL